MFGGKKHNATEEPKIASLQYQTSCYGGVIPVCYGRVRVPCNVIWYNDFVTIAKTTTTDVGKGGGSTMSNTAYTYTAAVALSMCDTKIQQIYQIHRDKEIIGSGTPAFDYTTFTGDAAQGPWTWILSMHPDQAVGYGGIAYIAHPTLDLGGSATVKNHNALIVAASPTLAAGSSLQEANPALVIQDAMCDPDHGMGWSSSWLNTTSLQDLKTYCEALYLYGCFAFTEARPGIQVLKDLLELTNSTTVWSGGLLKFLPYGDKPLPATVGAPYGWQPNTTPIYSLTEDDFIVSGPNDEPVKWEIVPQANTFNKIQIEFANLNKDFAPDVAEAENLGDIDRFGLRLASSKKIPGLSSPDAARLVAQLQLQRSLSLRNTYEFRLGWRYALLEPMDLVQITESRIGAFNQTVRIKEVEEDEEGGIKVVAENWPFGLASAVAYPSPGGNGGGTRNPAADPGFTATPVVFEPPLDLTAGAREVWIGSYGVGADWGGAEIWVSRDNATYERVGVITARARIGTLESVTTAIAPPAVPGAPAVDDTTTIWTVNLTASGGQLFGCSDPDWNRYATLSVWTGVGGPLRGGPEIFSYRAATLLSAGRYNLRYHKRNLFGTSTPVIPGSFMRLDDAVAHLSAARWNAGDAIYIKLASFNVFGNATQDLALLTPTVYTIRATPDGLVAPSLPTLAITSTVPA